MYERIEIEDLPEYNQYLAEREIPLAELDEWAEEIMRSCSLM